MAGLANEWAYTRYMLSFGAFGVAVYPGFTFVLGYP
jgi:hypothetical protein